MKRLLFIIPFLFLPLTAGAALTDSLEAYWTLDEASGTRVDSTANGNDLTDNNTVTSAAGIINNGADFERNNTEKLTITDASQTGLDLTSDFTVMNWFKLESTNGEPSFFSKWNATGNQRSFIIGFTNQTNVQMGASANGSTQLFKNGTVSSVSLGTLYQFFLSYDASAGTADVYIYTTSGTLHDSVTITGLPTSILNSSADFNLGTIQTGASSGQYYDGIQDEVGVWSRILTSDERTELNNSGAGLAYPFSAGGGATPKQDIIWFQ